MPWGPVLWAKHTKLASALSKHSYTVVGKEELSVKSQHCQQVYTKSAAHGSETCCSPCQKLKAESLASFMPDSVIQEVIESIQETDWAKA